MQATFYLGKSYFIAFYLGIFLLKLVSPNRSDHGGTAVNEYANTRALSVPYPS